MSGFGHLSLPWWFGGAIYYSSRGYEVVSRSGERFLLTAGNLRWLKFMNAKYHLRQKVRVQAVSQEAEKS